MSVRSLSYQSRRVRKILTSSLPFLCIFFIFLCVLSREQIRENSDNPDDDNFFWREATLPRSSREVKEDDLTPTYDNPVLWEEMGRGSFIVEQYSLRDKKMMVYPVSVTEETFLHYEKRAPLDSELAIFKGENPTWKSWGDRLEYVKDYFRYLKTTQTSCRKLARMGGTMTCDSKGNPIHMDGHKYICMDPSLMLSLNKGDPEECLVLSFGTSTDTAFDEVMTDLPCEVHMFDILDYRPWFTVDDPIAFFHKKGLFGSKQSMFFQNMNFTSEVQTLKDHVVEYNLTTRLIHVLKIDIENSEWDTLKDITKDPIFDAVGQLALEVHAIDLVKGLNKSWSKNLSEDELLPSVQMKYDILKEIEARGFRRAVYWDNYQDKYPYFDEDGIRHETSGELLYVNTNWYNPFFKNQLAARGYKFRDVS